MEKQKIPFYSKKWFFWLLVLLFPPFAIMLELRFGHYSDRKVFRNVVFAYCIIMSIMAGMDAILNPEEPKPVVAESAPESTAVEQQPVIPEESVPEPVVDEPEDIAVDTPPKQEEEKAQDDTVPEPVEEKPSPYTEEEQNLMFAYDTDVLEFAKACHDNPNAYRMGDALVYMEVLDIQTQNLMNDERIGIKVKVKMSLVASEYASTSQVDVSNGKFMLTCNRMIGGDTKVRAQDGEQVLDALRVPGDYSIGTLLFEATNTPYTSYVLEYDKHYIYSYTMG